MTDAEMIFKTGAYFKQILPHTVFHLCGSYFFGDATEDSDIDLFTDDGGIDDVLTQIGFKCLSDDGYARSKNLEELNKRAVYEGYVTKPSGKTIKINIFIVTSVESRKKAQQYCIERKLTKEQRSEITDIWDKIIT